MMWKRVDCGKINDHHTKVTSNEQINGCIKSLLY